MDWFVEEAFLYYFQSPQFHRQLQAILLKKAEEMGDNKGRNSTDDVERFRYAYSDHAPYLYWYSQHVLNIEVVNLIRGAADFVSSLKDKKLPSRLATSEPCFSETPFQYALRTNPDLALQMDYIPWMNKYWEGAGLKQLTINPKSADVKKKLPQAIVNIIVDYLGDTEVVRRAILAGFNSKKEWFKSKVQDSADVGIPADNMADVNISDEEMAEFFSQHVALRESKPK